MNRNLERIVRRDFWNEQITYDAEGCDDSYSIDRIISDLGNIKQLGYTHIKFKANDGDGWADVDFQPYVIIQETDEEMRVRINHERMVYEQAQTSDQQKKEILDRLLYEKLKLKFEGK